MVDINFNQSIYFTMQQNKQNKVKKNGRKVFLCAASALH